MSRRKKEVPTWVMVEKWYLVDKTSPFGFKYDYFKVHDTFQATYPSAQKYADKVHKQIPDTDKEWCGIELYLLNDWNKAISENTPERTFYLKGLEREQKTKLSIREQYIKEMREEGLDNSSVLCEDQTFDPRYVLWLERKIVGGSDEQV